jgi:general secretion pathway protein G
MERSNDVSLVLARCKPLSDPVRFFANVLRFSLSLAAVLAALAVAVTLWVVLQHKASDQSAGTILLLVMAASALAAPLGLWLFFRNAHRPAVIYLRAFRSDRPARRLRSLLKAALGNRFRLCGIRPPKKRAGLLTRLLARGWLALRYIGSEHFELEAEDHNWMARLLASYARSRFVFIDVRDLTTHVEDEIKLSYRAMGGERCIFLIDSSRTEEEWRGVIGKLVDETGAAPVTLHLLSYPGDEAVDAQGFVNATRQVIEQMPLVPVVIPPEAVALAKQHVSEKNWPTPFWETDIAGEVLAQVIGVALFVAAFCYGELRVVGEVSKAVGALGMVIFLIAWWRAWKQATVEKRLRQPGTANPRRRLAASICLVFFSPAIIGLLAATIYKLDQSVAVAKNYRVRQDIQSLKTLLMMYENLGGSFPTTEQGIQALAQRPATEPIPARWFQLMPVIPRDPWGNNYIYLSPGRKNPEKFDLYSAGPDRKPDTADDDWGEDGL